VCVYGQKVFSRKEVFVWCNISKDVRTALNDDPQTHRGRQRTSHTDNFYQCHCRIFDKGNRRVKFHEIAEVTGIAKSTVHKIISDSNFRKMSARLIPKMLTKAKELLLRLKIVNVTKMKENRSWNDRYDD
jgi:hypothetical protein